jgi:hypothetical protein
MKRTSNCISFQGKSSGLVTSWTDAKLVHQMKRRYMTVIEHTCSRELVPFSLSFYFLRIQMVRT